MRINKISIVFLLLFTISCEDKNNYINKRYKIKNSMEEEKTFFVTDEKNIRHEVFKITTDSFKTMEKEGRLKPCDSINKKYQIEAYLLDNGKAIVQESNKYAMYPSIKVLEHVLLNYTGPFKREFLEGLNPFGDDFPSHADSIKSATLKDLNIDCKLSYELILEKLDSIILRNRNNAFLDKYLLGFIALIGKHNIEKFGGSWDMVLADDKKTWNPGIRIKNQKVYFVSYILEDFLNANVSRPATQVNETVNDIIRINILRKHS